MESGRAGAVMLTIMYPAVGTQPILIVLPDIHAQADQPPRQQQVARVHQATNPRNTMIEAGAEILNRQRHDLTGIILTPETAVIQGVAGTIAAGAITTAEEEPILTGVHLLGVHGRLVVMEALGVHGLLDLQVAGAAAAVAVVPLAHVLAVETSST